MLEPNVIPTTEPALRVGIVLSEDEEDSITINIPSEPDYLMVSNDGNKYDLSSGDQIEFNLFESVISVLINSKVIVESSSWSIKPMDIKYRIGNKTGIKVKDVISGRGFHWKKFLDVYLPGCVEVKRVGEKLILINELPIEQYLMCVATSEMGAACPETLIESQTIVARSWMLANVEMKHRSLGFDVCNDDCCQRYQGTTHLTEQSIKGALNTSGKVLMYSGKICDARYSKSCGGMMEAFENVWGGKPVPYLKSIPDAPNGFSHQALPLISEESVKKWIESSPETFCSPAFIHEKDLKKYLGNVDEEGEYFRWGFKYSQEEITELFNEQLNLKAKAVKNIKPLKRGGSGRLGKLKIYYIKDDGSIDSREIDDQYYIRKYFHKKFLYSSAFIIDEEKGAGDIPESFTFKGAGWGHGVGYCQIGALGMALKGYSTENILNHYFPGSILKKIY